MEEASFFSSRLWNGRSRPRIRANWPGRFPDPLHGGADESKYESLRQNILAWDAEDRLVQESDKPPGLSSVSTHHKDSAG